MSEPKILNNAIGSCLKAFGFKKKRSDSWYFESTDAIAVLNLQKSAYSQQYYANIGIWLKALGEAEKPAEHKCHIRCRWESLIPEDETLLERLLNLEDTSVSDEQRNTKIRALLQMHVLPFFEIACSLGGLRKIYQEKTWPKGVLVQVDAQRLLGGAPAGA